MTDKSKFPFWVSWWHDPGLGPFTINTAWWLSGQSMDGRQSVCAAVYAADEEDTRNQIRASYDDPMVDPTFRFVEQQARGWTPYCDRFPKADWMTFT